MRATAQDPDTAGLMGVDVNRTIAITFLIGGLLAGAAGVAQILYNNYTVYNLGFRFGLNSFTAAVLGGIGNLQGAVLGALVIGEVNALSDCYLSPNWTQAIVFGVLIAHPRLQADRPARPAAGGSSMSGATETIGTGVGGWLGYVGSTLGAIPGQYRAALRRKRARTLGLTLLVIVFILYPVIGHYVLAHSASRPSRCRTRTTPSPRS